MFPGLRNPRLAALSLRGRQARIASFSKPARRAVSEVSMADAARFPHLALPFTITGAAAGWLSAGLVQHPVLSSMDMHLRFTAAVFAAMMGLGTGLLLSRWVVGEQYDWQVDAPDPAARPRTDSWPRHVATILLAGALVGAFLWSIRHSFADMRMGVTGYVIGGVVCTLPFVPVLAAVLSFARRAQRARLGSLVAASDRRAVWGILATTVSVTTLGALPNWVAADAGDVASQLPVVGMLAVSALGIAAILAADLLSLRRAKKTRAPDVVAKSASEVASSDTATPRLDLGLGDDIAARVARPQSAYRGRERAVALILGSPALSIRELTRAARRGALGLLAVAAVATLHVLANTGPAHLAFDKARCDAFDSRACARVADRVLLLDQAHALTLYSKACSSSSVDSCLMAASLYESRAAGSMAFGERLPGDPKAGPLAKQMFQRACRYGDRRGCLRAAR